MAGLGQKMWIRRDLVPELVMPKIEEPESHQAKVPGEVTVEKYEQERRSKEEQGAGEVVVGSRKFYDALQLQKKTAEEDV